MMVDPDLLIAEFGDAAAKVGIEGWPCQLRSETLPAPHQKPMLPPGEGAVYVFAISAAHGRTAPMRRRNGPEGRQSRTEQQAAVQALALPPHRPDDSHSGAEPAGSPDPVAVAGDPGPRCRDLRRLDAQQSRSHPFIHARRLRARSCRPGGLRVVPESAAPSRASRSEARKSYSSRIQQRHRLRATPPDFHRFADRPQRPPTTLLPGVRIEGSGVQIPSAPPRSEADFERATVPFFLRTAQVQQPLGVRPPRSVPRSKAPPGSGRGLLLTPVLTAALSGGDGSPYGAGGV
jgi:hypothetical protein